MKTKLTAVIATATIFTFALSGCSNQSKAAKSSNRITVTYTLRQGKKNFSTKKIKLKKHAKVMTGLKKGWKVEENKGFITGIAGKKQNPKKKIYWTYTINGKWANKGAADQTVKNKDHVKFTLAKVK
ncbi:MULTISPECIES: DUF4430 domain-containing protein [Lactobacillus]|uniref:DUF4430 domain-containing protein n=1 Tax=Lactobacillus xujianguonis TaxID=2495899 RepID=A0A437SX69_9LACO|nr:MULTISPECIES: DUF4430 domain-containing protein [Lactobacillus]RVU71528.1 DUF4430 domain-containing protein [Lactobacillus xujianguonis]RVU76715.1 DUF4430 domain-containing protein [Lactobacillus xujianguonis]